jgi:hypothetical protein
MLRDKKRCQMKHNIRRRALHDINQILGATIVVIHFGTPKRSKTRFRDGVSANSGIDDPALRNKANRQVRSHKSRGTG